MEKLRIWIYNAILLCGISVLVACAKEDNP